MQLRRRSKHYQKEVELHLIGDILFLLGLCFAVASIVAIIKIKNHNIRLFIFVLLFALGLAISILCTLLLIEDIDQKQREEKRYLEEQKAILDKLDCEELKQVLLLAMEGTNELDESNINYGLKKLKVIC